MTRAAAPRVWWRVWLLLGFAVLFGCDGLVASGPGPCAEAGAQCLLRDGPLGVCERTICDESAQPPCFACTPQH